MDGIAHVGSLEAVKPSSSVLACTWVPLSASRFISYASPTLPPKSTKYAYRDEGDDRRQDAYEDLRTGLRRSGLSESALMYTPVGETVRCKLSRFKLIERLVGPLGSGSARA